MACASHARSAAQQRDAARATLAWLQVRVPRAAAVKGKVAVHLSGLEADINVLRRLKHPNIVRYLVRHIASTIPTTQHRGTLERRDRAAAARLCRRAFKRAPRPVGVSLLQGSERQGEFINIFLEFVPGGSIATMLTKFGAPWLGPADGCYRRAVQGQASRRQLHLDRISASLKRVSLDPHRL
jgi:hypothetical protein